MWMNAYKAIHDAQSACHSPPLKVRSRIHGLAIKFNGLLPEITKESLDGTLPHVHDCIMTSCLQWKLTIGRLA